jgi:hypothetical protein
MKIFRVPAIAESSTHLCDRRQDYHQQQPAYELDCAAADVADAFKRRPTPYYHTEILHVWID